jgi:hypothetical protein
MCGISSPLTVSTYIMVLNCRFIRDIPQRNDGPIVVVVRPPSGNGG